MQIAFNKNNLIWLSAGAVLGLALTASLSFGGHIIQAVRISAQADAMSRAAAELSSESASSLSVSQHWDYSTTNDDMHGVKASVATLVSRTPVLIDGEERYVKLYIRRRSNDEFDAYFIVDGQFLCDDYAHPSIDLKFDNEKPESLTCSEADSGDSGTVFLSVPFVIFNHLTEKSKQMTAELDFYEIGKQQVTFDISGFDSPKFYGK